MTLFPRVRQLLIDADRADILLIGGGIIPEEDIAKLEEQGVAKVFGPGTPTQEIVRFISSWSESVPE
jgi:methylmalonyl-CoA mutase C-terminal domain/subunit